MSSPLFSSRRVLAAISGLPVSIFGTPALAQPLIANWSGGSNGVWSNQMNWTPSTTVPVNVPPFPTFDVRITSGGSPVRMDVGTLATPAEISLLTLGDNMHLLLQPSTALTVLGQADLCGIITSDGGAFLAETAAFTCNRARLSAQNAGIIHIDGPAVLSAAALDPAIVLLADGGMSELRLPSLTGR